jgi:hypothetical protein
MHPTHEAHHHGHHDHHGGGAAQLTLTDAQRWTTDAPLRQGMSNIRDEMEAQLAAIRAGRAADQTYNRLATAINAEVAYMLENCKLDKRTDAMLHLVIVDILAGTDTMLGKDTHSSRREGALKIAGALHEHGRHFDHPGWPD